MRKYIPTLTLAALVGVATLFGAFTDINSSRYWGKTSIPKITAAVDANFALIESGTENASFGAVTVNTSLTAISTNDANTNVIVNTSGRIALDNVSTIASNAILVGDGNLVGQAKVMSGDVTIDTNAVAAIAAGVVVNADVNASAGIVVTKLGVGDVGAAVAAAGSAAHSVGEIQKLVYTFTNVVMTATDTSDEGESVKIYDFDDGAFTILSSVVNASSVVSAGATNTFVLALGTAAAGDDSALTSTEANIIPSTSIDTTGGTVLTNAFDAIVAAPITIDGTATAADMYVNWAIADTNMDANVTNTITGSITILMTIAVDN